MKIEHYTTSSDQYQFVSKRVKPLMLYWGRFVDCVSVEQLVMSAYLQGVSDMGHALQLRTALEKAKL